MLEHPIRIVLSAWSHAARRSLAALPNDPSRAWSKAPTIELESTLAADSSPVRTTQHALALYLENTPALASLQHFAGLNDIELALFAFLALADTHPPLQTCLKSLHTAPVSERIAFLANTLSLAPESIESALAPPAPLRSRGLVRVEWDVEQPWLVVLMADLGRLTTEDARPTGSVLGVCSPLPSPGAQSVDFTHLERETEMLRRLLGAAQQDGLPTRLAVHGGPRSGRTTYVRHALAGHPDAWLIDGDLGGVLEHWEVAARWSGQRPSRILVVDLSGAQYGQCRVLASRLHVPTVNTLFILDSEDVDDGPLKGRFSLAVEVREPSQSARRTLVATWLPGAGAAEDAVSTRLAENSLADVAVAVSTARRISDSKSLASTALCLARPADSGVATRPPSMPFDSRFVNLDVDGGLDLDEIAARCDSGRFCFYGPPGTGKSALARALAERAGRPILVRRGSDIFGKYVGQTEQAIAAAFDEAATSGAVLVFDEIDGLLMDRGHAERNFEVRHVNEFLQQMDAFDGLLVCTTNRLQGMDPASLRRFELKAEFRPMRSSQRRDLLAALLKWHGGSAPSREALEQVAGLDGLVPGDFDAVVRRAGLLGQPLVADSLIRALTAELALRRRGRPVGFAPPNRRAPNPADFNILESDQPSDR